MGVQKVQSNLAAILMATTPLSATVLAHFFTINEKINFIKILGVLVGFSGIFFLFSDNILINENNFIISFNFGWFHFLRHRRSIDLKSKQ